MAEMVFAPEPLSVWEILDYSVRLYRRHLGSLFCAAALVGLATYPLGRVYLYGLQKYSVYMLEHPFSPASLLALLALLVGLFLLSVALTFIQSGVLAVMAGQAYREGRTSLEGLWLKLRFGRLLGACLLSTCLIVLGTALFLVPGFYCAINFALVPVVVVTEARGPVAALKRSWQLMRAPMPGGLWNNNVLRIMVLWSFIIVLGLLALGINSTVTLLATKLWGVPRAAYTHVALPGNWALPVWAEIAVGLLGQLVDSFFRPFALCALVLLYYDIRLHREGLDVELMLDRMAPSGVVGSSARIGRK